MQLNDGLQAFGLLWKGMEIPPTNFQSGKKLPEFSAITL